MEPIDVLYRNAAELVPLADGPPRGGVRGDALDVAGTIRAAAVAVRDGKIVATGPDAELARRFEPRHELDLTGYVVVPGFVDSHTHPVFADTREDVFGLAGAERRAEHGVRGCVRALRGLSAGELEARIHERLRRFVALGTTTIEAKSGYGLTLPSERKGLEALARAAETLPLDVHPTFYGAHEIAPEYHGDPDTYERLVRVEMMPALRELATSCDVQVAEHAFGIERARRVGRAALELGYLLHVHADQTEPIGGAQLAVELGAASAGGLAKVSDTGIRALAESATAAVLLPGRAFFRPDLDHPPARRLLDAGAIVALATGFDPLGCYTQSLPMIATLARIVYGMTPAACLNAITRNAAYALGVDEAIGTLHDGKHADFVALDVPSLDAFGYAFGDNPVAMTVKAGLPVALNSSEIDPELLERVTEEG